MLKDQDPGCAMRFQRSGMDQQAWFLISKCGEMVDLRLHNIHENLLVRGHSRIRKAHSHVQKLPVLAHFWQNHTFSRKCFPK